MNAASQHAALAADRRLFRPGSDPAPDGDTMFGTYASKAGEPHLNNMETEVIAGHDGKVKWR